MAAERNGAKATDGPARYAAVWENLHKQCDIWV